MVGWGPWLSLKTSSNSFAFDDSVNKSILASKPHPQFSQHSFATCCVSARKGWKRCPVSKMEQGWQWMVLLGGAEWATALEGTHLLLTPARERDQLQCSSQIYLASREHSHMERTPEQTRDGMSLPDGPIRLMQCQISLVLALLLPYPWMRLLSLPEANEEQSVTSSACSSTAWKGPCCRLGCQCKELVSLAGKLSGLC